MSLAIVFYTCLYIHSIHFYTFLFFPAILTPPKKKLQHGAVSTWMQSIWKARKPRIATDQTWIKPVVVSTWFQPRNKHMSLGSFVFFVGRKLRPVFRCTSLFFLFWNTLVRAWQWLTWCFDTRNHQKIQARRSRVLNFDPQSAEICWCQHQGHQRFSRSSGWARIHQFWGCYYQDFYKLWPIITPSADVPGYPGNTLFPWENHLDS